MGTEGEGVDTSFSLVKYNEPVLLPPDGTNGLQVLNKILPPREFEANEMDWISYVSPAPSTRFDVLQLREQLDGKLLQRQARDAGICQVRRELYAQCFDELIRQTTVNCVERGLLLLRIRDEARMTLHAYMTLYESSTALGFKRSMHIEEGKEARQLRVKQLEEDKENLEKQVSDLKLTIQMVEKRQKERLEANQNGHKEQLNFYKRTNQQLKSQLEGINSHK